MDHTTTKTLRYLMLPGLIPRIKALGFSGFGPLALFMAYVYHMARLLPTGHPYLDHHNQGRFNIADVILEARHNLRFRRDNLDQIIIFFMIPLSLVILALQFVLLFLSLTTSFATAADFGLHVASFFKTQAPENDIVFMLLDSVFGAKDYWTGTTPLFGSKVATDAAWGPWPTSFHEGLHSLFAFYSYGLFFVAVLILIYYVITLVGETAITGTPFGQRFNNTWAPIRLILAFALLIPLGQGLNGAQYLGLNVAKWGSGLATNSWIRFNESLIDAHTTMLGTPENLLSTPNAPNIASLLEFMFIADTCTYMYLNVYEQAVSPYLVYGTKEPKDLIATTFEGALEFTNNNPITIRFGESDVTQPGAYDRYDSGVKPLCGDLVIDPVGITTPGGKALQEAYYILIQDMFTNLYIDAFAQELTAKRVTPTAARADWSSGGFPVGTFAQDLIGSYYDSESEYGGVRNNALWTAWKDSAFLGDEKPTNAPTIGQIIQGGLNKQREGDLTVSDDSQDEYWLEQFTDQGWGGAAIWYNKIAEMNGALIMSSKALPSIVAYPEVMEHVKKQRLASDPSGGDQDLYMPVLADGQTIEFEQPGDQSLALALYYAQNFWHDRRGTSSHNLFIDSSRALFDLETIGDMFGLEGLFAMNENRDAHPMAQLVGIGASLIHNSVSKFGYAGGLYIGSFLSNAMTDWKDFPKLLKEASGFMGSLALFGLSIGFILYYVVPFLPFFYFFFAMGNWVKALFESVVGLPLWALAHIKIDGEGLPGPAALNGYQLLLETLLRPVFIVFGLLASIIVFSSQVSILHEIWDLVLENVAGGNRGSGDSDTLMYIRGEIDTLFYTVIYAIIVYMLAMSSFKLIDLIPNGMMRWMGISVASLAEQLENPSGDVIGNIYIGSNMALGQMSGGMGMLMMRN